MSKPPTKFGQLKVKGLSGASNANVGKTSVTSRGLNIKQGAASGVKKKSVNSNAVKGKSVVTRNSKMAKVTPQSAKTSYQTVKARMTDSGQQAGQTKPKATAPINQTSHARSPLQPLKDGKTVGLSKKAALSERPNQTTHKPYSPLSGGKSHAVALKKVKTKPINKYGSLLSPLS